MYNPADGSMVKYVETVSLSTVVFIVAVPGVFAENLYVNTTFLSDST
ncbi:MAG TPA: hypothetical protein PL055_04500 [Methanobacterium sp.]|jgi:hypothetical protein|nr:hypothetical protein [Methanobacterium sp.]HPX78006.1 hypothetical protein [Methanobacterium sp.]